MKQIEAHVTRHDEQLEKVSRGLADLSDRIENLELAGGGGNTAIRKMEDTENRMKAAHKK